MNVHKMTTWNDCKGMSVGKMTADKMTVDKMA